MLWGSAAGSKLVSFKLEKPVIGENFLSRKVRIRSLCVFIVVSSARQSDSEIERKRDTLLS